MCAPRTKARDIQPKRFQALAPRVQPRPTAAIPPGGENTSHRTGRDETRRCTTPPDGQGYLSTLQVAFEIGRGWTNERELLEWGIILQRAARSSCRGHGYTEEEWLASYITGMSIKPPTRWKHRWKPNARNMSTKHEVIQTPSVEEESLSIRLTLSSKNFSCSTWLFFRSKPQNIMPKLTRLSPKRK